jgi:hypothetical protein
MTKLRRGSPQMPKNNRFAPVSGPLPPRPPFLTTDKRARPLFYFFLNYFYPAIPISKCNYSGDWIQVGEVSPLAPELLRLARIAQGLQARPKGPEQFFRYPPQRGPAPATPPSRYPLVRWEMRSRLYQCEANPPPGRSVGEGIRGAGHL